MEAPTPIQLKLRVPMNLPGAHQGWHHLVMGGDSAGWDWASRVEIEMKEVPEGALLLITKDPIQRTG